MFCLSHFNQKSASPVGPYIFSRGRANFLSQIDTAKVQYRHCGSRMLAEENCAFQDLFFYRWRGHLVICHLSKSKTHCQNQPL